MEAIPGPKKAGILELSLYYFHGHKTPAFEFGEQERDEHK